MVMMLWVIVYPSLVNGVEAKHQFNARNQLIKSFEGDTITDNIYDGRGNLTQVLENGQQKTNYTFDAANQLVSVANRLGSASYGYDGFRNRVKKLENMTDVRYVNDMTLPYNNLLDMNGQSFVWGNSLLSAKGEKDFYYLQDHLGSPVRLLGENQDDVLGFDEFGVPKFENDLQPFGFTGYQIDGVSGLQYAQTRYYDPMLGRFSAEDPIKDQVNWYGYCNGNPVNFIDPSGLRGWTAEQVERFQNAREVTPPEPPPRSSVPTSPAAFPTLPTNNVSCNVFNPRPSTPEPTPTTMAPTQLPSTIPLPGPGAIILPASSINVPSFRDVTSALSSSTTIDVELGIGKGGSVRYGVFGAEALLATTGRITIDGTLNNFDSSIVASGGLAVTAPKNVELGLSVESALNSSLRLNHEYHLGLSFLENTNFAITNKETTSDFIISIGASAFIKIGGGFTLDFNVSEFGRLLQQANNCEGNC